MGGKAEGGAFAMRKKQDFLEVLGGCAVLGDKLAKVLARGEGVFEQVALAAQPTLAAFIARRAHGRVWVICGDARRQEAFHQELSNWFPESLFFPESELPSVEGALGDPESTAERLSILEKLGGKGKQCVVVTAAGLRESVPSRVALKRLELRLERGVAMERDALLERLVAGGYEQVAQVSARGQFAVRGGILDVFSYQHLSPVRVEFFGDELESLRYFDLDQQTSVEQVPHCVLLLGDAGDVGNVGDVEEETRGGGEAKLRDYVGKGDVVIDAGAGYEGAGVRILEHAEEGEGVEDDTTAFYEHGLGEFEAGDFVVDEGKRERFFAQLREWREAGWAVFVFCNNEGEAERLRDLVPPVEADALRFVMGALGAGFVFPAGKVAALSDAELFGRYRNSRARRVAVRRLREQAGRVQMDFSEWMEDDLVVHFEHGIGRYEGTRSIPNGPEGRPEEVLVIAFAGDAKLYVPLEQAYLVAKYVGVGRRNPPLSVLGDGKWARAKQSAEKAVFDYAGRLLEVQAARETAKGHAFAPDNRWVREFEASFLHKETPDQLAAIAATKADMEAERPMDRLVCGDVGFGKTEVAIRAAFKAVMGGKQVALLVPTTVLAQQHYQNFRERMSDYPVRVESLSRFRSGAEQRQALEGLRDGSVDIVVGTHRLISKDVQFRDLGLVIIDEEQRFGVLHKEKFKELFHLVDMLTLSATPIPRTLYLSLMGAKDMSTIETAPANRVPTETLICPYDERIIRDAILRELKRQGQVYFLHNRVQDIDSVRAKIRQLCPKARVVVGHGQMDEGELEEVMQTFVSGKADVLVSTTIIESGLDIPNANTIIIDRADRFGLADLYQLRGRVGRSQQKAYAYLMLPRDMLAVGEARKRISAIKQYSSLGAGFKIAMRDLEIRGAGNVLGTAQSGHIITVGFDLYCGLLRQAVAKLKGQRAKLRVDVVLRLDFVATREAAFRSTDEGQVPAFLPLSYLSDAQSRIQGYRRLAEVSTSEQLAAIRKNWTDRYGRFPEAVQNLLLLTELKLLAAARKITVVEVRQRKVMLTRGGDFILLGGKFPRLSASTAGGCLSELAVLLRSF
jgi:transcription-repair coupling factor (superfamily II helicase)